RSDRDWSSDVCSSDLSLRTQRLEQAGIFPAEFFAPYIHTVGTSGNYSDETFTQTVFRYETVYDFGLPFFDVAKETTIDRPALPRSEEHTSELQSRSDL